jgi:hypothetical protein
MKNLLYKIIPKDWIRDWGADLLNQEGYTILHVGSNDLTIISSIDCIMNVKGKDLCFKPKDILAVVFTKQEPISVVFNPPMEVKI